MIGRNAFNLRRKWVGLILSLLLVSQLTIACGIEDLLSNEGVSLLAATATPGPTATPTQVPLPLPNVSISAGSASQITELVRWGKGTINELAYSPNGQMLAVASSLGIYIYAAETLSIVHFIETDAWTSDVAFSPDGAILASGLRDNSIQHDFIVEPFGWDSPQCFRGSYA
jgi:WD40 repeat protein